MTKNNDNKDKNTCEILHKYYGYDEFRPGQEELIQNILAGNDVMGIMPTGAGKSICYQIPALLLPGITIVISPLISLMKDQVGALVEAGIPAAFLNSSLSVDEYRETINGMISGQYKVVYVAPERLGKGRFLEICRNVEISLVAVDEAHCISQWGQDFRPSYLEIVKFIRELDKRPVVGAFTATATKEVKEDIVSSLQLRDPFTITTGFDRPNLTFIVYQPSKKDEFLLELLRKYGDRSGIIYCATRKNVEKVGDLLSRRGYPATIYHAGLPDAARKKNQDDFINDRKSIVVATNAFGMGIDKSNVGFVIHYNMPKSMEHYYQEAGRAGRDGAKADCVLLYSPQDVHINKFLITNGEGNPNLSDEEQQAVKENDFERLKRMTFYATTKDCLRGYILKYFGEWAPPRCENCSNCLREYVTTDITDVACKIIRCLAETGQRYGASTIAETLKGSKTAKIRKFHLDECDSYGSLGGDTLKRIREYIDTLIAEGHLRIEGNEYPILKLTRSADGVIKGGVTVTMAEDVNRARDPEMKKGAGSGQNPKAAGGASGSGPDGGPAGEIYGSLRDDLKKYRISKSRAKGLPAYIIFNDKTLDDLCRKRPTTKVQLLGVSGFGEKKTAEYGDEIIAIIRESEAKGV